MTISFPNRIRSSGDDLFPMHARVPYKERSDLLVLRIVRGDGKGLYASRLSLRNVGECW